MHIAAHGHARWHMDTNCNAWARTPSNGHAVAGTGFKAETPSLNWIEQEAFEDEHPVFKKCLIIYAVDKCVFKNFV